MLRIEIKPRDLEAMIPEQNIPFLSEKMSFYAGLIKVLGNDAVVQFGDLALCETLMRRIDILPDDHPLKVEYKEAVSMALQKIREYFGGSIEDVLASQKYA